MIKNKGLRIETEDGYFDLVAEEEQLRIIIEHDTTILEVSIDSDSEYLKEIAEFILESYKGK